MPAKIQLFVHDIATRLRLKETWTAQGVAVLAPTSSERPDCAVVDLARRDALADIARLRAAHPDLTIVACAAGFEEAAVIAAKAAGASDFAAHGFVERRVARLLKLG